MGKKKCALTVLLAAAVLFVMLSSVFYIAAEAGHDCTGSDCPICYQIGICENTVKSVGQITFLSVLSVFAGIGRVTLPSFSEGRISGTSLVTLKVKLSN